MLKREDMVDDVAHEVWRRDTDATDLADCYAETMRVFAALEAMGCAVVQGWQPIESAPRDGTVIDLWANGLRYADAYWDGGCFSVLDSTGYGVEVDEPTHWMPLPASPMQRGV